MAEPAEKDASPWGWTCPTCGWHTRDTRYEQHTCPASFRPLQEAPMAEYLPADKSCNRRFHPTWPLQERADGIKNYWYFCRLRPGHTGPCDCQAAHEDRADG